jgi:hypothetical protein
LLARNASGPITENRIECSDVSIKECEGAVHNLQIVDSKRNALNMLPLHNNNLRDGCCILTKLQEITDSQPKKHGPDF